MSLGKELATIKYKVVDIETQIAWQFYV